MKYQEVKRAIAEPLRTVSRDWVGGCYQRSELADGVYEMKDLAYAYACKEQIRLQFYTKNGKIVYRPQDSKRTFTTIDEALGNGGRQSWLLDCFRVSEHGLLLQFLPKYSQSLNEAARIRLNVLNHLEDAVDDATYEQEAERYHSEIRHDFARRLWLTGNFQAWYDDGFAASDIINCSDREVVVLSIEDCRKYMKIIFNRRSADTRCLMYV